MYVYIYVYIISDLQIFLNKNYCMSILTYCPSRTKPVKQHTYILKNTHMQGSTRYVRMMLI